MTKILIGFVLLLAVAGASPYGAHAQVDYSKPDQRNPQRDKDVEEGYQRHQREYKDKQEREQRKEKGEIEEPYKVRKSGDTTEHQKKD